MSGLFVRTSFEIRFHGNQVSKAPDLNGSNVNRERDRVAISYVTDYLLPIKVLFSEQFSLTSHSKV